MPKEKREYKVWVTVEIEREVDEDYETVWKSEPISAMDWDTKREAIDRFNEVLDGLGPFTTYKSDYLNANKLRKAMK